MKSSRRCPGPTPSRSRRTIPASGATRSRHASSAAPSGRSGDGLRLFPGRLPDRRTATPFVIPDDIAPEMVWGGAGLPGRWSVPLEGRPYVLGRIAARVDALPTPGQRCVVMGTMTGEDGRKAFTVSSLYGPTAIYWPRPGGPGSPSDCGTPHRSRSRYASAVRHEHNRRATYVERDDVNRAARPETLACPVQPYTIARTQGGGRRGGALHNSLRCVRSCVAWIRREYVAEVVVCG
jgi:hypothetical protein